MPLSLLAHSSSHHPLPVTHPLEWCLFNSHACHVSIQQIHMSLDQVSHSVGCCMEGEGRVTRLENRHGGHSASSHFMPLVDLPINMCIFLFESRSSRRIFVTAALKTGTTNWLELAFMMKPIVILKVGCGPGQHGSRREGRWAWTTLETREIVRNRHPWERTWVKRRTYYKDTRLEKQLSLRDNLEAETRAL